MSGNINRLTPVATNLDSA